MQGLFFLYTCHMKELVKLVVFVPEENADEVREALGKAGAGKIGEYSFCSFSIKGVGRFKPSDKANPHIGTAGAVESVNEERIEVACEKDQASEIIKTIKEVHPYEEVVIDVYSMISL
jgi:hypothetical protein